MSDLPPLELGSMPASKEMKTVDERLVVAPLQRIFRLAAEVERWPALLPHYRFVRFVERRRDGGGIVDMSANRPFGIIPVAHLVAIADAGACAIQRLGAEHPVCAYRWSDHRHGSGVVIQ